MEIPLEWKPEAEKMSIHFTHDCKLVLYSQLIQTGSMLLLHPFSTVLGFTLYKDKCYGIAAKHKLYIFAKMVW